MDTKILRIAVLSAFLATPAFAEWTKWWDWDPSYDQEWSEPSGAKGVMTTEDGGRIEVPAINGRPGEYTLQYLESVPASGVVNLDAVQRTLGENRRLVMLNAQRFQNKSAVTVAIMPPYLEIVGGHQFERSGITSMVFPNTVTNLGDSSFEGLSNLQRVHLSSNLLYLGSRCFHGCTSLDEVENGLPDCLETIGGNAFYNTPALRSLHLPKSLRTLGGSAFEKSDLGGDMEAANSLSCVTNDLTIGDKAFHSSKIFGELNFTNATVSIGDSTFYGCPSVTAVRVTQPGSMLVSYAFASTDIRFADIRGLVNIPTSAFSGPRYLTNVVVSACVTNIGTTAFQNCNRMVLTPVLPANPKSVPDVPCAIGVSAFKDAGCNTDTPNEIIIPFRGPCTLASNSFHFMNKTTNFVFWGKAPTSVDPAAWDYYPKLSEKIRITVPKNMGWEALAEECSAGDKALPEYPGPSCFGKYTNDSGKTVFWLCYGDSPYASATGGIVIFH